MFWRFDAGGTPLTIPNREVKPLYAEGTTLTGGRIGRRQPYSKLSFDPVKGELFFPSPLPLIPEVNKLFIIFCFYYI